MARTKESSRRSKRNATNHASSKAYMVEWYEDSTNFLELDAFIQCVLDNGCRSVFDILHDKDERLPGSVLLKEPHHHLVFWFFNPKDNIQFEEWLVKFNDPMHHPNDKYSCWSDIRDAYRYLVHADNPDKFQYPADAIISYGEDAGKRWLETKYYRPRSDGDFETNATLSCLRLITDEHVSTFTKLLTLCSDDPVMLRYINKRTSLVRELIREQQMYGFVGER